MKTTYNPADLFLIEYVLYCNNVAVIRSKLLLDIIFHLNIIERSEVSKIADAVEKNKRHEFIKNKKRYTIIERLIEPIQQKLF